MRRWSIFKRSIVRAYHKIRVKRLDAYLQALEFRFNSRDNQFICRDVLRRFLVKGALRYER